MMFNKRVLFQLLFIVIGVSAGSLPLIKLGLIDPFLSHQAVKPTLSGNFLQASTPTTSFQKGIQQALQASRLARDAQTTQEWDQVVLRWLGAVTAMQSVPISDPEYRFAQKKVAEYLGNLTVARERAETEQPLPFASFESEFLNEQLALYLSYLAAVGTPDILIVGSSRAVQGIDPRYLQYGLADQGKSAKIFNFGINGATAQVVDLLLREVLTPQQLPETIIWADGARAFNSGRTDRTYNQITNSPGYQSLQAQGQQSVSPVVAPRRRHRLQPGFLPPLGQPAYAVELDPTQTDANGFLPVSARFNPKSYFQTYPLVRGRYDADYQNFSLAGAQREAWERLVDFTQQQQIQLVIVNLPLTQIYLDSTRLRAEDKFVQYLQQQAQQNEFVFFDWGRIWLEDYGYFADPSHLNRYGAATLGRELAKELELEQLATRD